MSTDKSPSFLLHQKFPFEPTPSQASLFQKLSTFVLNKDEWAPLTFIIKGYAGTGKTTVISTLIKILPAFGYKTQLMAPTGRAAKVMANYAKKKASTIHKKIYRQVSNPHSGALSFQRMNNYATNTVFIVDEASMITDESDFGTNSLLTDLIEYVFTNPENGHTGNKLIFVGDTAQLPPVNMSVSPALDIDSLSLHYQKNVHHIELDEVMRQAEHSGILYNATELRELLHSHFIDTFQFKLKGFKDIVSLQDGYEIQDAIHQAYDNYSIEDTVFILRSNKRANQYNQQIRTSILSKESEISTGDYMMVVKNNYFWLKEESEAGFIANGDIIEILEIRKIQELYGFKFATVKVRMVDYPNQIPFDTVIMLDTIMSESPSLTYEESNKLYQEVLLDYEDERQQYKKLQKVKENEYFNALQVKFSYAITCHKSQGGQWKTVFVEQPYLPNGIDIDYVRWLYTAITRAEEKLYLIGFKDEYFHN